MLLSHKEPQKHLLIGSFKKPMKWIPGVVDLHDIWKYQKLIELLIHKFPCATLICEITVEEMADVHLSHLQSQVSKGLLKPI